MRFQKFFVLLFAVLPLSCSTRVETRPNVLFILADDLGYMDSGIYGSDLYETPNIDRLAKRGVRFVNAYSASPLCTPTRASLLTGKHPAELRLTSATGHLPEEILEPKLIDTAGPLNPAVEPQSRTRLPQNVTTYADVLQQAGYRTGFIGKWHLGPPPYSPENNGFEHVVGGRQNPGPPPPGHYFAPWHVQGLEAYPEGTHISTALVDEAIRFIGQKSDKPFLLNLWFYDVHAPFQAPHDLIEKYEAKISASPKRLVHRNPTMGAMIEAFDQNIGRLLDHLENEGLLENTVVIFTSDNGGNMYDRVNGLPPTDNSPYKGGKGINYQGGVKVPLILHASSRVAGGRIISSPTSSIDIFPTILDAISASSKESEGTSLFELVREQAVSRELFFDFPHYVTATGNIPNSAVLSGDWKLYQFFFDGEDQQDRIELYNIKEDIGETLNIAEQHPGIVASLINALDEHHRRTNALLPIENPSYGNLTLDVWDVRGGELTFHEDVLVLESVGKDPYIFTRSAVTKRQKATVSFEMKSTSDGGGQIFWSSINQPSFSEERSKHFSANYDNQWHQYVIVIDHHEPIMQIRIDPSRSTGRTEIRHLTIN